MIKEARILFRDPRAPKEPKRDHQYGLCQFYQLKGIRTDIYTIVSYFHQLKRPDFQFELSLELG